MNVEDFIFGLTPDDIGGEEVDGKFVKFEGFTGMCWEGAEEAGKSVQDLEDEILAEWDAAMKSTAWPNRIDAGWTEEPIPYEDTIIYAIYSA